MVMHARKLPRISDGFSDKHQSHNSYESKYGGGSGKYRQSSQVGYPGNDKRDSPSANSLRSSSPDSRSQSPRYHKSSSSNYYKRERDYGNREHSRDHRGGSRSPKERRRDRHMDQSCRNSTQKKEGNPPRVGDWSEHVSSNGKRYYYNHKSEKSQWEKPQDWLDWEHHRHKLIYNSSKYSSNSNSKVAYNNLNQCSTSFSSSSTSKSLYSSSALSNSNKGSSYCSTSAAPSLLNSSLGTTNLHHHLNNTPNNLKDRTLHDKPKLDKHSNLDGRDHHYRDDHHFDKRKFSQDMDISSGGSTPTSECVQRLKTNCSNNRHYNNNNNSTDNNSHHNNNNKSNNTNNNSSVEPLSISVNNCIGGQGPPTPTHSESHDPQDIRKGEALGSRLVSSIAGTSSLATSSAAVSSLSSLTQQNVQSWGGLSSSLSCQRPSQPPPALTPSLGKYFNEALITHVKDWPAENLEKQGQRMSEEVHTAGSLIMTRVSADLKMARAIVRLSEIQTTLHEQRKLFLKALKSDIGRMRPNQNNYSGESQQPSGSGS